VFSLKVDDAHRVLLITVTDKLGAGDFTDVDTLLKPLTTTAQSLDTVIIDLRAMAGLDISMEQLFDRARSGPPLAGRRHALIVADPLAADLCRLFAEQRERAGHGPTIIVPSLEEAYRTFAIDPVFR
jgi:hypothetical protein